MTGPSLYDQYLASQGPAKPKAPGTGSLYDRYLTETSGADPNQALHDEFKSGRLAGRMARENANDRDESDAAQVSLPVAAGQALSATGANIAQGIPGMEAVQAYLRGKVRGQPYREALSDIRGNTEKIPTVLRVGERIAGAVPLAAMLPGSPAVSGAIVGGADQAFAADPDMSLTERGIRTGVGAIGGAVVGKVMDKAFAAGRAMMTTKPATLLLQKQAERAASAKRLYDGALAEGNLKEATPAIQSFLANPDIAEIVTELQSTTHAGTPAESPQMLDAIYKTLSDRAAVAKKGLDQLNPSRPNIGRFRMQDIKNRQQQLLRAMESPGEKPAMTMDVPGGTVVRTDGLGQRSLDPSSPIGPVHPAETHVVEPKITAGRDPMAGPVANGPVSTYTEAPNPTLSQGLRNFWGNTENAVQGPGGPQFQLRAQPDVVKPGVTVETPSMRIQTAPAEQMPPMMSGYRHAVEDFAQRTREIEALQRGYEAVRTQLAGGLPSAKNLTRKTPEAFADWAKTASPEEIQAARQGMLGAIKDAISQPGATFAPGRRAASVGANLLHVAPTPGQTVLEGLQNAGLLWAGGASSPSPKSSLFPP